MKKCTRCKLTQPLKDFNRQNGRSYGRTSHCRSCRAAHARKVGDKRSARRRVKLPSHQICYICKRRRKARFFNKNRRAIRGLKLGCRECDRKKHYGRESINRRRRRKTHPERYLWMAARIRARRDGLKFNIKPGDVVIPSRCPILGIKLIAGGKRRTDNTISLDRINPARGYVKGNIIVVSWRVNRLKSDASLHELCRIASYYSKLERNRKKRA